jgi:deoxycytidylate deaminase
MRRLKDVMRARLASDAEAAERATTCRRRGTMARAVVVEGEDIILLPNLVVANGGASCLALPAGCGCPHAEQKLIVKILRDSNYAKRSDLCLLSSLEPCEQCANLIVESGLFSRVAWLATYRDGRGQEILRRANIFCQDGESPFFSSSVAT